MNRRSFISRIGGVIAAAAAPQALLGGGFKWNARKLRSGVYVVNPEWRDAPYEVAYLFKTGLFRPTNVVPMMFNRDEFGVVMPGQYQRPDGYTQIVESFPIRLNERHEVIPPVVFKPLPETFGIFSEKRT